MKNKAITFFVCSLLLCGCATAAKYEAVLNSWTNAEINRLTDSWGYPSGSFIAPNGNRVYVYQRGNSVTMPTTYQTNTNVYGYGNTAYGRSTTNVYGGETLTFWCRTFFEVDSSNIIIKWSYQGNNCVSK